MKKGIIIQARMSSKRLPGKSMRELHSLPMIYFVIDRCRRVKAIDEVILATSSDSSDDVLAEGVAQFGVPVFRGDLDNVQKRYFDAAFEYDLDVVIRVTGDNPLISHELIELLIAEWERNPVDYIAFDKCTYGTGSELFTVESFKHLMRIANSQHEIEHVTPGYYEKKGEFKTCFLSSPDELYDSQLRLTVDTEADFLLMEKVYNKYAHDNYVLLRDVIQGVKDAKTHR